MKYLRLFKTEAEYSSATLDLPNVSYIEETKGVSYEPYVPMNIITYYATDKLVETTSAGVSGLCVNAFNSPMVSHEFVDGVGTITFEEDITTIGNYAFYDCKGLTSINIPDSVTSIGSDAFYGCTGLTSIVIPDSVTSIGDKAFYNCSGLTEFTCHAVVAPTIRSNTFRNVKSGGTLYVPAGSTDSYLLWMSTGDYYLGKYNWTSQEI